MPLGQERRAEGEVRKKAGRWGQERRDQVGSEKSIKGAFFVDQPPSLAKLMAAPKTTRPGKRSEGALEGGGPAECCDIF